MSIGNTRQNQAIAERVMGWTTKFVTPKRYRTQDSLKSARLWAYDGASRFVCPNFTWNDAQIAERKAMEDGWKITVEIVDGKFYVEFTHSERDEWGSGYDYNRDQASMNALCEAYGVEVVE